MFATKINNIPETAKAYPFIVAQFDEDTKTLWYYGAYKTIEKAQEAARSEYCHNGIVFYNV